MSRLFASGDQNIGASVPGYTAWNSSPSNPGVHTVPTIPDPYGRCCARVEGRQGDLSFEKTILAGTWSTAQYEQLGHQEASPPHIHISAGL